MAPSVEGEDELVAPSDDGLEYDEQASLIESEDSGSEFEVSGEEAAEGNLEDDSEDEIEAYAKALEEDGIDADDVLLDAALQESIETARHSKAQQHGSSSSGVGSSSSKKTTAREVLRAAAAAAAERRLTRAASGGNIDVDNYVQDSDDDDLSSLSSDDSDAPISKSKKGKGKAQKAKKTAANAKPVIMTVAKMKQTWAERKAAAKARRDEARDLKKKLGRKPTQVRYLRIVQVSINLDCRRPKRMLSCLKDITLNSKTFGAMLSVSFQ